MDESNAVEAFEELGLTSYEAKVFIALHRLGSGTARNVAEVTDVPRSQVYSATESLADRGLVGIQQSSPKRFRPVSIEAARSTLRERFERESDRAFEYVSQARSEGVDETREDIWTIRGQEGVTDRTVELIRGADRRIVFASRTLDLVPDRLETALVDRAEDGVEVTVVSLAPSVRDHFADRPGIDVVEPPPGVENERNGRLLVADRGAILLSVVGGGADETAIWSSGSGIASVLIRIVLGSVGID